MRVFVRWLRIEIASSLAAEEALVRQDVGVLPGKGQKIGCV